MGRLSRLAFGGLLIAAGTCLALAASTVAYPVLFSFADYVATGLVGTSAVTANAFVHLLVMTATGATSGWVLLLVYFAAGAVGRIDWRAWPNLSSVWLLWVFSHVALWIFGTYFT